jgi:hypothetical protein
LVQICGSFKAWIEAQGWLLEAVDERNRHQLGTLFDREHVWAAVYALR